MKKLLCIVFVGVFFISIGSCKRNPSELNQITSNRMTCHALENHANYLYKNYKQYFKSNRCIKESFLALSNIPESYFINIFTDNSATVDIVSLNGGFYLNNKEFICGVTLLKNTDRSVSRIAGPIVSTVECLPHEFGHDTFQYLAQTNDDFISSLETLSNTIESEYKDSASEYLNLYKTSHTNRKDEVLAELFDTWYCSQAARNLLKETMPKAYEFAEKYFLPPVDPSDTESEESVDQTDDSNTNTEAYQTCQTQIPTKVVKKRFKWFNKWRNRRR